MSDSLNGSDVCDIENTEDKGINKTSLNFFNNIINRLNLSKINQANTIFIILISIYFFVIILLACLNPPALKNLNYAAYLQVGLITLIVFEVFFVLTGNLKNETKKKKSKNKIKKK